MNEIGITIADIAKEFKEEAIELLDEMERALVSIQESGVDKELINAVFRAAHTIKGTAGMYKIDYLVKFTHVAESLFDMVRNDKIELDDDIIELMYASKDHMLNLVEYVCSTLDSEKTSPEIEARSIELIALLEAKMDGEVSSTCSTSDNKQEDEAKSNEAKLWIIKFNTKKELFERGFEPHSFISYLKKLGTIKKLDVLADNVPLFSSLSPTECYLNYYIEFESCESKQEIEDVFDFIQFDADVTVSEYSASETSQTVVEVAKEEPQVVAAAVQVQQKQATKDIQPATPAQIQNAIATAASLRVDAEKIDHLINLIGEMVIANANVVQKATDLKNADLIESVSIVSRMLEDIRESAMQMRMVQIGETFNKFKRIVLDIAKKLGKQVELTISGGDTELDKTVIEKITDPLVHILRNAIDHGLEMPEDRIAAGKDPKGTVTLNSYHDAGTVVIEITDNGKGLNEEFILRKAIEKGVVEEGTVLGQKDIFKLIFEPGFSTAAQVTDLSGRGVGMDVVRRNIEALRGNIEINSELGKGTSFIIRLPLTLAIIDGFLVMVGDTFYVIPLEMVIECMELDDVYKEQMHGNNYVNLRGSILPLLNVREYFNENKNDDARENIVVVQYAGKRYGFIVDALYGEFQTVIKPLGRVFRNVRGISGASILGSGKVALILDVPVLGNHMILQAGGGIRDN